jgi:hypothetical protein
LVLCSTTPIPLPLPIFNFGEHSSAIIRLYWPKLSSSVSLPELWIFRDMFLLLKMWKKLYVCEWIFWDATAQQPPADQIWIFVSNKEMNSKGKVGQLRIRSQQDRWMWIYLRWGKKSMHKADIHLWQKHCWVRG